MPEPELNPKKAALKGNAAQLAKILGTSLSTKQGDDMPESITLQPGQKVGARRFTLVKPLGRGGMGVVWLAHDTNLDESVALKFLPPEIASDSVSLNDLRRETVRSHKLTHPNIIRIHDFQKYDEAAFISMEYVDGETLSDRRLQQTQQVLTWAQLAPLVEQLCAALEYAHGEKVIHRDLKPANMMVDSKGRLKLADFGIAAVVSDSLSKVSVKHSTSGTPPYMSPQQLAGKHPQVTDDLYALGATLYELLTSKPPFYTGDIIHQVLHEAPEPMEERLMVLGIDNEIPPAVGAMVMSCLAKEPEKRPQSAGAVAGWIGLEVAHKPSLQNLGKEVFSGAPQIEAAAPSSGKKPLWAVGVFAALLLLAAGGWYWAKYKTGENQLSTAPAKPSIPIFIDNNIGEKANPSVSPEPVATSASVGPNDLTGHWRGVLDWPGKKLRLLLHVAKLPNGDLSGMVDSLDQGAYGIPASTVRFTPPNAHLEWPTIGSTYDGRLQDGKISGKWKQRGRSIPLVFVRITDDRSPPKPVTPTAVSSVETPITSEPTIAGLDQNETWMFTTIAGKAGNPGAIDGIGSDARFNLEPGAGIALDSLGNLYVADGKNNTIRVVKSSGVVSTLAGQAGSAGTNDGLGVNARFTDPRMIALDQSGNAYVSGFNSTIRKITPSGMVTSLALRPAGPVKEAVILAHFIRIFGLVVAPDGNIFVAHEVTIRKITPDGVMSVVAGRAAAGGNRDGQGHTARFAWAFGLAIGKQGLLYVVDANNNSIRVINPNGEVSTLAGGGAEGSADGEKTGAQFKSPRGIAVDGEGNLYVTDWGNNTIRKITSAGVVTTIGGFAGITGSADGTGAAARFNNPSGIALDAQGNIYVSDVGNNTIRKGHRVSQAETSNGSVNGTFAPASAKASQITQRWTNSLGMVFVPVPGTKVLFCIWDTRVQDFAAFASNTAYEPFQNKEFTNTWKTPGFAQGPTHPLCYVSWNASHTFCQWLTAKEQADGLLGENQQYRLPTVEEWSTAAGNTLYSWGYQWPPPAGAGNFAGSEVAAEHWPTNRPTIDGYNDGFARTSPVGSFAANRYGLFDMGGNLRQACEDPYNGDPKSDYKLWCGSTWGNGKPSDLLLSHHFAWNRYYPRNDIGFRCVLATTSP